MTLNDGEMVFENLDLVRIIHIVVRKNKAYFWPRNVARWSGTSARPSFWGAMELTALGVALLGIPFFLGSRHLVSDNRR